MLLPKLSIMMFLQFFIWGAWYVALYGFLVSKDMAAAGAGGSFVAAAYTVAPIAAILAPLAGTHRRSIPQYRKSPRNTFPCGRRFTLLGSESSRSRLARHPDGTVHPSFHIVLTCLHALLYAYARTHC